MEAQWRWLEAELLGAPKEENQAEEEAAPPRVVVAATVVVSPLPVLTERYGCVYRSR